MTKWMLKTALKLYHILDTIEYQLLKAEYNN